MSRRPAPEPDAQCRALHNPLCVCMTGFPAGAERPRETLGRALAHG
ncbi:hypothetical protein [Streptomyces canus]|nr:hypothetical protein [Streptomyces canus]